MMPTSLATVSAGLFWSGSVLHTAMPVLPPETFSGERTSMIRQNLDFDASTSNPFQLFYLVATDAHGSPARGATAVSEDLDFGALDRSALPTHELNNEVLSDIVEMLSLKDGWDGTGSVAPTSEIIEDAIVVAQLWPSKIGNPAVDVSYDGKISFEVFNEAGFLVTGIELIGEDHQAVFSVVSGSKVLATGRFSTNRQTELLQAFASIDKALA